MNKLIEKYASEKRWVNWRFGVDKNKKMTKVPLGSSNNPDTWSTFDSLVDKEKIGFMFGLDKKFLGIDLDHCIEDGEIVHSEKDKITTLLDIADTYTELSPSGTGLHLYFTLSEPLDLIVNKHNVNEVEKYECYSSLRYFTVTSTPYGEEKDVRTITPAEALSILSILGYPWGRVKKEPIAVHHDLNMTDEELLKDMFASKNGDKIQALYNGDLSQHNNDASSADMALCLHLAYWTAKNPDQMDRIWVSSPLGQREKTQGRKENYRAVTIQRAIDTCSEVYKPIKKTKKIVEVINEDESNDIDFDFLFVIKGSKNPIPVISLCTENIVRALNKHPDTRGNFRYDEFKMKTEIKMDGKWVAFEDKHILIVQSFIATQFVEFQTVKKDMIYDAILKVADEHKIDSAIDYMKSTKWDGESRIESWLQNTYGVEDNEYHQKVGSNWLKGLVKRIIYPGCKFDYVLVLEGEQGSRKSSSLATLGQDWHVETTMSPDSKDFFMQFSAKAIIEFSEGETLSRADVKKLKAIITTQVDKFRAPYERVSLDHPRRCVFAMTTNNDEYLKDETGNRRWWPVRTVLPKANIEWLQENRDQLFAEAYHRVHVLKESTWEVPEEQTKIEQDSRQISDPNEERFMVWYHNLKQERKDSGVTIYEAYCDVYFPAQITVPILRKPDQMNIANIFKNKLNLYKKVKMSDGVKKVRWFADGTIDSPYTEEQAVEEQLQEELF